MVLTRFNQPVKTGLVLNTSTLGGVVAHEILVSAQGPLVLGFLGLGLRGLGPGLDKTCPQKSISKHCSVFVC